MTTAAAWLLVGVGLLTWPGGRASPRRRAHSRRALQCVAAVAVAGAAAVTIGGVAGVAAAVASVPLTVVVVGRLHSPPGRPAPDRRLALALDLTAAALRCGRPLADALDLAAPVADEATRGRLSQVSGLLRLGAAADAAWRPVADDPVLGSVAQAAVRSADSGVRLARGLEQAAADLRDDLRSAAERRAHRAGVLAMLPLGLCFLPAFVCVGVVPVVIGAARGALSGVP